MDFRTFHILLFAVCLLTLVPLLRIGAPQFIGYDGYWHLFTATQDRWDSFLTEWRGDAHPVLYYLVLRLVAKIGTSHLVYRSASILPGVAGVYIMGRVSRELLGSGLVALLAALAYGLSITMIDILCDVRSYPLALFFVLAAFWCFLRVLGTRLNQGSKRYLLGWSLLASLGLLTEYYVAFFILACLAVLSLQAFQLSEFRDSLFRFLRANPVSVALSAALLCCTAAWLYYFHLRYQPNTENNVNEFYWTHGTSIPQFIWYGLRSDLDFLLPFSPHSPALASLGGVLLLFLTTYLASARKKSGSEGIVGSSPGRMLLLLIAQLAALSIARRYPFGGYERQQSILFPFVILSIFSVVDLLQRRIRSLRWRTAVLASLLFGIAANFAHNWVRYPKVRQELFSKSFATFRSQFPSARAVYVDQFSLIAYFIQTYKWKWHLKEQFRSPDRLSLYTTVSRSGEQILVLRNLDQWNFDLLNPATYEVLAKTLKVANLTRIDLFFFKQGGELTKRDTVGEDRRMAELASRAGLLVGPRIYNNAEGFIAIAAPVAGQRGCEEPLITDISSS